MPRQREMTDKIIADIEVLLRLKVDTKLLQQKLSAETGQVVTMKDIHNISTQMANRKTRNDLDSVVHALQETCANRFIYII